MAETFIATDDHNIEFLAESVCALCGKKLYSDSDKKRIGDLMLCSLCNAE